jgi:hypothetical protein
LKDVPVKPLEVIGIIKYQLTVTVEPADDDGHCRVDTGNGQEEGTVLDVVIVLDTEQNRESSEGDEQREEDE